MEKKVQRQFDEKEGQIREEQLALVKKLGEAEQAAATMRDALVPASCQSAQCKNAFGHVLPQSVSIWRGSGGNYPHTVCCDAHSSCAIVHVYVIG